MTPTDTPLAPWRELQRSRAKQQVKAMFAIDISQLSVILELKLGAFLLGTPDGYYFVADEDEAHTVEDEMDRPAWAGGSQVAWDDATQRFIHN